jgi:hypothetical protein
MRTTLRAGFCVAQRGLHYERSSPFTTTTHLLIKRYRHPIKDPAGMFRKRAIAQHFERACAPHSIDTLGAIGQRAVSDEAECRGGLRRRFRDNSENIDIKVFEIEKRACRRRPRLAADHRLRRR